MIWEDALNFTTDNHGHIQDVGLFWIQILNQKGLKTLLSYITLAHQIWRDRNRRDSYIIDSILTTSRAYIKAYLPDVWADHLSVTVYKFNRPSSRPQLSMTKNQQVNRQGIRDFVNTNAHVCLTLNSHHVSQNICIDYEVSTDLNTAPGFSISP